MPGVGVDRKRKSNPQPGRDKELERANEVGAQTMLTAATIVLMETYGFPEEWITEWTQRTLATAIALVNGMDPSNETVDQIQGAIALGQLDELLKQMEQPITQNLEFPVKPTDSQIH